MNPDICNPCACLHLLGDQQNTYKEPNPLNTCLNVCPAALHRTKNRTDVLKLSSVFCLLPTHQFSCCSSFLWLGLSSLVFVDRMDRFCTTAHTYQAQKCVLQSVPITRRGRGCLCPSSEMSWKHDYECVRTTLVFPFLHDMCLGYFQTLSSEKKFTN